MSENLIDIEVAIALPDLQHVAALRVPLGTTARMAVLASDLAEQFPNINFATATLGIFSHVLAEPEQYCLQAGERVEIYRPLLLDPKEARRQRARQKSVKPSQGETG